MRMVHGIHAFFASFVGLVLMIPLGKARRSSDRDGRDGPGRDEPGHDAAGVGTGALMDLMSKSSTLGPAACAASLVDDRGWHEWRPGSMMMV
jgi:hypothetical protein